MRNKFIKLLAWVCLGISFVVITGCSTSIGSEPMLKITTSTANRMNLNPKTTYYIVYENGAVKKTDEFVLADVINYYFSRNDYGEVAKKLYDLDINTPEGEELKQIANNILLLMDETKFENISANELFIFGEKYFFTAIYRTDNKYRCKVFEYISADNSVKEIASFNKGSIDHVELYRS